MVDSVATTVPPVNVPEYAGSVDPPIPKLVLSKVLKGVLPAPFMSKVPVIKLNIPPEAE